MSGPAESLSTPPEVDLPKTDPTEAAVMGKVTLRLIPFLFVLYVINILDRANIGFAKLRMMGDLGLSEEAYGLGAGIFYVGYVLFEVPSNLMLARTGARRWIARILVTWGIISACMMFVRGPWSFYSLRVLLGVAEAGFFPGIILYLSQWFPARQRARAVAKFMVAGLASSIIGNPASGLIMQHADGLAGLKGWQWVFLLEGLPAVALGIVTFYFLTDRPEGATWLSPAERDWLCRRLREENEQRPMHGHNLRAALTHPVVWLLILIYFTVALGDNAMGFYLPTFLEAQFPDWKVSHLGFLSTVPAILATFAMLIAGAHSDRTGERRWHVAGAAFVAAIGWTLAAWASSPWLVFLALVLTLIGMKCMLPTFWSIPTAFLSGTGAAGGIALINSFGNIGGFLAPTIMGHTKATTLSFTVGMLVMSAALCLGALLTLTLPKETTARSE